MIKKLLTALVLATALTLAMSSVALADTTEQEVECTTGAYGQTSTCKVKGVTTIVTREGVPIHEVVNTGVDTPTALAFASVVSAGVTAAVLKRKLQ